MTQRTPRERRHAERSRGAAPRVPLHDDPSRLTTWMFALAFAGFLISLAIGAEAVGR